MAGFYSISLAILLVFVNDAGAAAGDLNDVCITDNTCTPQTSVCDPIAAKCLIKQGQTCTANPNYCTTGATCSSTCTCASVYTADSTTGLCNPKANNVGGTCTDTCADANAECTGTAGSKRCTCKIGYTVKYSDLSCYVTDNTFGGACTTTSGDSCVGNDANAVCINDKCACKSGYSGSIGKKCYVTDNTFGGACTTTSGDSCVGIDANAVCINNKCACKSGYSGSIGKMCSGAMAVASSMFILIAALLLQTHLE